MRQATRGIDSLLAVAAAVSRVADEEAKATMAASRLTLFWYLLIVLLAAGLSLLGLIWVRRTANALFRQKELAEVTLHSIGDAVITTDAEARVDYLNPVAEEMTGWKTAEARGRSLAEVFRIVNGHSRQPQPSPIEICLAENRVVGLASNTVLLSRGCREYAIEDSAAPIRDREHRVVGGVLVFYDVLQSRYGPHLLGYHASHDPVTGLINRAEFERRLCEFRVRSREHGERHALCYVDLDQFRVVNDTCGHGAGDQLLRQVAGRLGGRVRESDILARLGGDEFGLLLANCPEERAAVLAEQVREAIGQLRFEWDGKSFDLHASIGLVPIGPDSPTPADLLAQADAACNAARQKGRNRVQVYAAGDLDMARRHGEMQWIARLTRALEEDRFVLYCQPIVPLRGGMPHFEILLRLKDEDGRIVPPGDFIPAAERYDLMPAIDRWVIRRALAELALRQAAGVGDRPGICGLNVSGASLGDADFEAFLRGQFAEHGIPPSRVCLEITETAAVANLEQAGSLIRKLRAEGFRFALDDFGSGLSPFMYLKSLPVDYLKIDGGFVRAMTESPVARATVQAIHGVGQAIGIATIAEYAENDAILDALREMGIDYAQGYGVGRPVPMADYLRAV
ncbi:MAG TPA: EAL domain-containing protein [Thiobacillaceae bacterium]|nr:EAL domain-containing protein [Thiobacillaceae bacterium]